MPRRHPDPGTIFVNAGLPISADLDRLLVRPGTTKLEAGYYTWAGAVTTLYSAEVTRRALNQHETALRKAAEASDRHATASEAQAKSLTRATQMLAWATIALVLATAALVAVTVMATP
jgi:hypothetical protein